MIYCGELSFLCPFRTKNNECMEVQGPCPQWAIECAIEKEEEKLIEAVNDSLLDVIREKIPIEMDQVDALLIAQHKLSELLSPVRIKRRGGK